MHDAFISYSRANLQQVETLKLRLDERRLDVFRDNDSLSAGKDWRSQLGAAIQKSRMMVLCWSAEAAESTMVEVEIEVSLLTKKRVVPWLLDNTPLPPALSHIHGITGADPARVVNAVAEERTRSRRLFSIKLVAAAAVLLAPSLWIMAHTSFTFRGHVVDEQGNPVADATVEAGGVQTKTGPGGDFLLSLRGRPGGPLKVRVSKIGYISKVIETVSDVPDLGVVLEKDR
jgi:hypothetical protein